MGRTENEWANGFLIEEGIAVTDSSVGGEAGRARRDRGALGR
jgi:hypothetical protein